MPGHASTSTARLNIHGAKVMLCVWWDQLGVVYYELLKPSGTITGDRYRTQLMSLSRALKEKWPQYQERHDKVILQRDNARPQVAKPVKTYLETMKWEVLPHPSRLYYIKYPNNARFRSCKASLDVAVFRLESKTWKKVSLLSLLRVYFPIMIFFSLFCSPV